MSLAVLAERPHETRSGPEPPFETHRPCKIWRNLNISPSDRRTDCGGRGWGDSGSP